MKFLKPFMFLLVAGLLFSACTSDLTKILPKNDGMWDVTFTSTTRSYQVSNDSLIDEETDMESGTMDFRDNGTGTLTSSGDSSVFTWSYNADREEMTIVEDSATIVFDVLESSNKSQRWEFFEEFEFFGVRNEWTIEANLSR
jgi:hypothetical protein